ncbi:DMT family protein [soil metagenome]
MAIAPILLLTISNVFMTFAWYWHLTNRQLKAAPIWIVILASWGIAFFEYCFQVPGNRLGYRAGFSASQLKIMQEAITLVVFCVFARIVMKETLTWNYYVGFLFVLIGVFFVFGFKSPPLIPLTR